MQPMFAYKCRKEVNNASFIIFSKFLFINSRLLIAASKERISLRHLEKLDRVCGALVLHLMSRDDITTNSAT
jgi:hypothetical protein